MKKYVNPMLQVVSINHNDIITGSDQLGTKGDYGNGEGITLGAPDHFRDYEVY